MYALAKQKHKDMRKCILHKIMLYDPLFSLTSCGDNINVEHLRNTVPRTNNSTVPGINKDSIGSAHDTQGDSSDSKGATPDLQPTNQLARAKSSRGNKGGAKQ